MRLWQKYWLYFLLLYSLLHIIRDVFQDLGVKNFLSMMLVKKEPSRPPIIWTIFNTYVIALIEIILAAICLKRKSFGKIGYLTILIGVFILIMWSFFWFIL